MADGYTDKFRRRYSGLRSEFDMNWLEHFKDITEYLMPRKGRYLNVDENTPNNGQKRNESIIDGTGGRALRILAAGMQSGLTSPARPWFRLGLADKDLEAYAPVRFYLDEVRRRMMTVFSKSNFYSVIHNVYSEMGGFGTAAMLVEQDYEHIIRCYPFTCGEYVLGTDATLRADTLYRWFFMTAIQLVNMYGEENCSDTVKNHAKHDKKDIWHKIIQAIEPNFDRDPTMLDGPNKPWISVTFEENAASMDNTLKVGGYDMFPVMAPRWDTTGSEIYGRSPGMDVLPDIMMLQKMQEKKLRALDKIVDPPMNAPSSLKETGGGSIISGGVNYLDPIQGAQKFEPAYQIKPDINAINNDIMDVRNSIKEGFYNDLFLMLAMTGNKEMTAREVAERHEEKLLSVGPVVERIQPELLDRMIDRTYDVMGVRGMLPEPPEMLEEMDIEVEYIGLLAQAQKLVGTSAIEQTAGFTASLVEIWPEARHKFDALQAVDEFADMVGVPTRIIVDDDEVDKAVEADAAQARQAQQAESAERMAAGAKTLSETDMDKNSALKMIQGGQQGGPQ